MAFEFIQNRPHEEYKNTFLQNVIIVITYALPPNVLNDRSSLKSRFDTFLKANYSRDPAPTDFIESNVSLINKDQNLLVTFGNGFVRVVLGPAEYHTFNYNAIPHIFIMRMFLKDVLKIQEIESLTIKKINLWSGEFDENSKIDIHPIEKFIFSEDLSSKLKPNSQLITSNNEPFKEFMLYSDSDKEDSLKISAQTAYTLSEEKRAFSVILDTEAVSKTKTEISKIEEVAISLNNILYELYHWCVTEDVIKMMKEENYG